MAGDAEAVRRVVAASFPTTAEADLVDALRKSGDLRVSLVALDGDVVVGHVAFSPVSRASARGIDETSKNSDKDDIDAIGDRTSDGDGDGIGLAPVAVLESHRCRGIAAALIERGLEQCRELGYRFAVVLGEPTYYRRFGFEPAYPHGLTDEYGGGDAFQVLEFVPAGIGKDPGLIRYAPAFASLS
jgi:putative acetyltransferase